MTLLAEMPIIWKEQKIGWTEKYIEHRSDVIQLYSDRIEAFGESYPLDIVFDISYRREADKIGFLYLHTTKGVRTFYIHTNPESFIQQFRDTSHI
ncbi:hypothetical protein B0H94_107108 [Salsuginibacillus halophilus]|uniref:Uncharacterized protein n=1 Tax=Salsuginibacillus halophilus TaxID=517424 RepID=A0A2P8HFX2_9BACI|nr:hypothetical protein [Salsuginibacillus halophilus]PSL45103.1 hypothetical protein B0H94_107108 [Salsuginibacillus halophilus]